MLIETIKAWRIIHLLALSNLRARYARSKFGQVWISLTSASTMLMIGIVWSNVWKQSIGDFLTYLCVGQFIYIFIASIQLESCSSIVSDSRLYILEPRPYLISTIVTIYRNIIIFVYSVPTIYFIGHLWKKMHFENILSLYYLFSIILTLIFLAASGYAISLIAARFRDIGSLIAMFLAVSYELVPVLWKLNNLNKTFVTVYLLINPYADIIVLLRDPILGMHDNLYIAVCGLLIWIIISVIIGYFAHEKLSKRLIFWIA